MNDIAIASVELEIASAPEHVYDAWLNPSHVRAWMSQPYPGLGPMDVRRIEIDAREGGRFLFSDMRAEGEVVHQGTYLTLSRPDSLSFTWFTSPEDESCKHSVIALRFEAHPMGCLVSLTHELDPTWAGLVAQAQLGWRGVLGQIEAHLSGRRPES